MPPHALSQAPNPTVAAPVDVGVPPVAQPVFATPPDAGSASTTATNAASISTLVVVAPAAARFETAMASYNAGQFADAITAFSDFIGTFPQDRRREEALYRLAESYRRLGRNADALAAYSFQAKAYPDGLLRANAELQRGALLFDTARYADAVAPLQYTADKGEGELQDAARFLLARAFLNTQREPDARPILQALADSHPARKFTGNAAQTLAEVDDSEQRYAEALPQWEKALALADDPAIKATAAVRGGWSALSGNQFSEAEKLFQAARELSAAGDARKVANTGLLRIFFKLHRYEDWAALYDAEKAALLDSARAEILYDLGHAEFSLKHWDEAVAGFDQYLGAFSSQDAAVTAAYERFLALTQLDRAKTLSEGAAYLKAWPASPYAARVRLLQAQELSREKNFADALPIWESLSSETGDASWPHQQILLEIARAYDELKDSSQAASAYQVCLDDINAHPPLEGRPGTNNPANQTLQIQARLAVCLQKSDQLLAATDAWRAVQALAPHGSPEQQAALEALGLIYARGGPSQEQAMVATFRDLLDTFPQSPLHAMAAFTVGDSLFKARDYAGAEPLLLEARNGDAANWMQPATQRLVLGAYGLKDYAKTIGYLRQYDALPPLSDPQAQTSSRLPAALFYWLGETAANKTQWDEAETWYARVTEHPDAGNLLAGAWWQLGEVQGRRGEWAAAVASYGKYRELKPDAKDATVVLLALGRAELGATEFDEAKKTGDQALLGEPEGPRSAAARMLLGETAYAAQNYPEAARMFATLSVLFDDPKTTPQAMARTADAFAKAGDTKSAADWRAKLQAKYPGYKTVPYL